jgi:hypothetical protein
MDSDTTMSKGRNVTQRLGRQRQPGARIALRVLLLLLGAALGVLLDGILLVVFVAFMWGIGDAVGARHTGWPYNAITWLNAIAGLLTFLLMLMLPVAGGLGAATIGSDRLAERGLRDWAAAMGIITGVMLVLDVLALVVANNLAGGS